MWVKSIILVVLRTVRTLGAIFIFHAPVNNRLEFPAIKYFYGGEEERKENNHGVTITIRYRARFNDRENRMHEFVLFFCYPSVQYRPHFSSARPHTFIHFVTA